jgi:hypothetical protein
MGKPGAMKAAVYGTGSKGYNSLTFLAHLQSGMPVVLCSYRAGENADICFGIAFYISKYGALLYFDVFKQIQNFFMEINQSYMAAAAVAKPLRVKAYFFTTHFCSFQEMFDNQV